LYIILRGIVAYLNYILSIFTFNSRSFKDLYLLSIFIGKLYVDLIFFIKALDVDSINIKVVDLVTIIILNYKLRYSSIKISF